MHKIIDCDLNCAVPTVPEIYTDYKYWYGRTTKLITDFNMLVRLADAMYIINKLVETDINDFNEFVRNIKIDTHITPDVNVVLNPTMDKCLNFKDTLTIACATILKAETRLMGYQHMNVFDREYHHHLADFEIDRMFFGYESIVAKHFNNSDEFAALFKACHVHLYNLANKNVSGLPESGQKVCSEILKIFRTVTPE